MEQSKSFEASMKRLEEIVRTMERGEMPLEQSLALFEEGTALVRSCAAMLDEAEMKIVKLMKGPDGQPVELTQREFALLETLLENKGIVLGRNTLMERVWGYDYMGETNIVDVYMRYLRTKLDDAYGVKLLYTVRGVGYVLRKE